MSGGAAGGAFGGARGLRPVAPEKGVFPLDHYGECKELMRKYMECLKQNKGNSDKCSAVAKEYLQCRMERNLMAKQDLAELGFRDKPGTASTPEGASSADEHSAKEASTQRKESTGFVAGVRKKKST